MQGGTIGYSRRVGDWLMPGRLSSHASRPDDPRPFSSAWLAADPPAAPTRRQFRFPAWVPDGRSLSAAFMVVVSLAAAVAALVGGSGPGEPPSLSQLAAPPAAVEPTLVATTAPTVASTATVVATVAATVAVSDGLAAAPAPQFAQPPDLALAQPAAPVAAPPEGPLLPEYRVVSYYGHPHDPAMGIVGEHAIEDLATMLEAEAANYAAADPSRPVVPAFELIATVAQRDPGADGTYILDTSRETLMAYIDYAAANGQLVILDLQIGRGTVASEIEKVRDLLAYPHVHLAIDPEFAVAEGEIPGEYIGSVTAESITYAQQVLAEISTTHGTPPKLLVVHQFREDMIANKEQLAPYPGVQLVIDADGYGAPELKTAVYNFLVRDEPVEFAGVKLFYRQDVPVMSAREILALVPSPDVIIYQ
jgi:hypothetical protein